MTKLVMLHSILLFAAAASLLLAVAHDVAVRTVPNRVSLVVAAAGLGVNALDGQLASSVFSGGVVFAGCWFCWRSGWIGGGDVKLLSACALLVPPAAVPALVLSTAIAGAILALLYLGLARLLPKGATPRPTGLLRRVWRAEQRRIRRHRSLPYACAISAGVLLTLSFSALVG
jgi:prepilin peptidase CpaA